MVDIGIDWSEVMRSEIVTRFIVAPFFGEAGSLLCGAALLWQGRYGRGRVIGAKLTALAGKLRHTSEGWRQSALGWSDPGVRIRCRSEGAVSFPDAVGPLLSDYWAGRSYHSAEEPEAVTKNPLAARRLVTAAAEMIASGIPDVRMTGDHLYRDKTADGWEDELEGLGELSCAEPPDCPDGIDRRHLLSVRAACLEASGLCHTMASVLGCADDSRHPRHASAAKAWYARAAGFEAEGERLYRLFANPDVVGATEAQALLSVRDRSAPYVSCHSRHYRDGQALEQAAHIVTVLINAVFRKMNGDAAVWMPEMEIGTLFGETPRKLLPAKP
jgi:hypothetical protein